MSVMETVAPKVQAPPKAAAVAEDSHLLQRKCACSGSSGLGAPCAKCADDSRKLRRKRIGQPEHGPAIPGIVDEVLDSSGQPLDAQTRAFMEPRFGHDFSKVRVHTDQRATQSAASVNALAYTVGQHIVFGAGQFAPTTGTGKTLLAHELTHVVQQASTGVEADAPELQRQETSHEGGGAPGACVVREEIPASRSGLLNGGGVVGERFTVGIQWRDSPAADRNKPGSYCDCACGEYHQFVKGHLIINGQRETWHLWGGAVLEDNVYHEDGLDKNPAARYGHRREPLTMDEDFLPNRDSGCTYVGRDFPRVMIGSDTDMLFQFKGQTYDACNQVYGPIHEWEVRYAGPIKR